MTKKELRKQVLEIRDNLSKEEIDEKSQIILKKLETTPQFQKATRIMLFASFSSEVKTIDFIQKCIDLGMQVYLPYIENDKESIMKAVQVNSLSQLQPGYKGILEIKPELVKEIEPENIELIVTPCVCYDYDRYRVGYGKGYYDRFFLKTHAYKIGVCFDECMVEKIDIDQYDVPVDMVITDKRVFI